MSALFELPAYPPAASPLQQAMSDIHSVSRPHRSMRREMAARQVVQVDRLLEDLEQLHLRGYVRVPDPLVARIEAFLRTLPEESRRDFPVRTRITRVLDELFEVQDSLLSIKVVGRQRLLAEESAPR
jgi:hypothetical protein